MSWLKDNFHINRIQRLGLIVLAVIIFVLILIRTSIHYYLPLSKDYSHILDTVSFVKIKPEKYNHSSKRVNTKRVYNKPSLKVKGINPNYKKVKPVTEHKKERFHFDPNTVSKDSLIKLGFKPYVADNLIKYRSKGATFYKKEDLERIYGIENDLLLSLKDFIVYPVKYIPIKKSKAEQPTASVNQNKADKPVYRKQKSKNNGFDKVVNLNIATKNELLEIPGIGKYYADQIIKLRQELNGFYSKEQLLDIYRLSEDRYQKFESYIKVDDNYGRIKINSDNVKLLAKHKYISWKIANVIVNYRNQHGGYKKVDDLKNIKIIDDNLFNKIEPYVSLLE